MKFLRFILPVNNGMRVLATSDKDWISKGFLVAIVILGAFQILTLQLVGSAQAQSVSPNAVVKRASFEKQVGPSPLANIFSQAIKSDVPTIPPAPTCSRAAVANSPSSLKISLDHPGISELMDNPQYYQVYGYTRSEVYRQMNMCMPIQESGQGIVASTSRTINWEFVQTSSETKCVIKNAAVGVHISQMYPNWNNSPYAVSTYSNRWQSFMNDVTAHENNHRDLDIQFANKILYDLQNMDATDCSSIVQMAQNIANADVMALDQANKLFDSNTDHRNILNLIAP